ncbi:hypothetical protein DJ564_16715 [Pseudomonas sp. 31-12]|uniref:hypothetical protein n=1 Tax=Pseudomonas sp. 31-12 TaxID=2201356 RepID=UPI000D6B1C8B|nr:hypothetical protein [Pseudomonas sp. 31-12]AWM92342.1 hypothetical protein DJ564_16715 [Pseudomonas sp. 31-12]
MSFANVHQAAMKQQSRKGRCLHFSDGLQCNEIISAHSIQKRGQLGLIAESGHVYRLNADLSTLKETEGKPLPKKIGVNRASTFPGMCKQHDNKLFSPIDDHPLAIDHHQVALYAYRSICREYFVKENASISLTEMLGHPGLTSEQSQWLTGAAYGQSLGFERLKRHKLIYDGCLAANDFTGLKFIVFGSTSRCSLQASGLIFPDFDFQGRQLQDLGPETRDLDLLVFFTAPTEYGWAFILAWHESSDLSCQRFINSLAKSGRDGGKIEDMLLRFSLACCENHAIRISWWDSLLTVAKNQAIDFMAVMADPTLGVRADYLATGCEGLADWSFDNVRDVR